MLTPLNPEYTFTDGPAYVVGDYPYVVEGDTIMVHVPSLMPEIPYKDKETVYYRETVGNTIFLNDRHPNFKGVVAATTCVPAKATDDMILKMANAKLYERTHMVYGIDGPYLSHIPRKVHLEAGTEVGVSSDIGTFKDLHLC